METSGAPVQVLGPGSNQEALNEAWTVGGWNTSTFLHLRAWHKIRFCCLNNREKHWDLH